MREKLEQLIKKIRSSSFIEKIMENKMLFMAIVLCVLLILCCLIFLLSPSEDENQVITNPSIKVENLLFPEEPTISQDYFIMTPQKKLWGDEEKEKWFYEPDSKTLNQLYKSNDILIQNILEEAP
ncbi:MAG: hypothetical protein E7062_05715 [Spirochaetaceae bacterium]|nr:hypothetical protein [Spirochaetaceae bacterium]